MKINNKIRHTSLFLLLSFSMGAQAEKPASPLQTFKSQTEYQTLSCTITANDRVIDYKQRMSEMEVKVNAAWNNFEVEHGL